jgi:hypothetical protein
LPRLGLSPVNFATYGAVRLDLVPVALRAPLTKRRANGLNPIVALRVD